MGRDVGSCSGGNRKGPPIGLGVDVPRHARGVEGEGFNQAASDANDDSTRRSRGSCMTTFWGCTLLKGNPNGGAQLAGIIAFHALVRSERQETNHWRERFRQN